MSNLNPGEEQNFRLGISLIVVLLVILLVIFGVYAFRSKQPSNNLTEQSSEKGGIFSRLFKGNSNEETSAKDSDKDGLIDQEEDKIGTDSFKADTDNDGLNDREEKLVYNTDPKVNDTDGDGIIDGDEIRDRHDPKSADPKSVWPPRPAQFTTASN